MARVSEHFVLEEFSCKCGCKGVILNCELIQKLERLRERFKKPIIVHSGYRCKKHNTIVGGAINSQHLLGTAADITISGISPESVAKASRELGFGGIGVYGSFTHVDVRKLPAYWNG